MNETFAVGEVCEALLRYDSVWREAIVVSPLRPTRNPTSYMRGDPSPETLGYEVDIVGLPSGPGWVFCIPPERLRKRKPPREDLQVIRWADCPWQPEREVAN